MYSSEHYDEFWYWLQPQGNNFNRPGIINAIAERVKTWIPGVTLFAYETPR